MSQHAVKINLSWLIELVVNHSLLIKEAVKSHDMPIKLVVKHSLSIKDIVKSKYLLIKRVVIYRLFIKGAVNSHDRLGLERTWYFPCNSLFVISVHTISVL